MNKEGHFWVRIGDEEDPIVAYWSGKDWYIPGVVGPIPSGEIFVKSGRLEDSVDINAFMQEVHKNAREKGWHVDDRSPLEIHALIHSEISEATEEVRGGKPDKYVVNGKPEGEAIELVDAVIRIADYFGARGWDLKAAILEKMEYNTTRSYRHGGKLY